MSSLPETTESPDLPDLGDIDPPPPNDAEHKRRIENVPVKISAVLGKTKIDIAALRDLDGGAVIELDRKVGDPIDLYVNDRLIGRGELVMIDGALGVTLTELVKDHDL